VPDISKGITTTHFRRGGMFSDEFYC